MSTGDAKGPSTVEELKFGKQRKPVSDLLRWCASLWLETSRDVISWPWRLTEMGTSNMTPGNCGKNADLLAVVRMGRGLAVWQ